MKNKATHSMVFIAVQIRNRRCIDMLRYDSCVPANEEESGKFESVVDFGTRRWVIFRKYVVAGGTPEPTVGRWESFGEICLPNAFKDIGEARKAIEWYNTTYSTVASS